PVSACGRRDRESVLPRTPCHGRGRRPTFLFPDTAPPDIYTLSLHDALPISSVRCSWSASGAAASPPSPRRPLPSESPRRRWRLRSEEHTSEVQSRFDLVCRLLLEKKNSRSRCLPVAAMLITGRRLRLRRVAR